MARLEAQASRIPEPLRAAQTLGGRSDSQLTLAFQMGVSGAEVQKLKNAVSEALKAAQITVRSTTHMDLKGDRDRMGLFLAECGKLWPDLAQYQHGWPAKACLSLLIRSRSKLLFSGRGGDRKLRKSAATGSTPHVGASSGGIIQASSSSHSSHTPHSPVIPEPTHALSTVTAFAACLRKIHTLLPLAQKDLISLGVRSPATIKAFAHLPDRDMWLREHMLAGKLTLKSFQLIRTAMANYCLVTETAPPRFANQFKPTKENVEGVVLDFLNSIYPRLGHLLPALERLGIVTVYDLEAYISTQDYSQEFYAEAVRTSSMSPLDAKLICNAFTVLTAMDILPRFTRDSM